MTNIIRGGQWSEEIRGLLNRICERDGGIQRDNDEIWSILHSLPEDIIQDVVQTWLLQNQITPGALTDTEVALLQEMAEELERCIALGKSFVGVPNVAKSGHKRLVWRWLMQIREAGNRQAGVVIANRPPEHSETPRRPPPKADPFAGLFVTQ